MNFLRNYALYSSGNEAPQVFHDWCAIVTIANVLGRRVWIDQGLFKVYPHLYVMLVGNPASGKSFAMSLARRLVTEIGTIPIAPSIITREAVTLAMGADKPPCKKEFKGPDGTLETYSQYSFFSDELLNLLGRTPEPIMNFFLEAWSNDIINVGTKNMGSDLIVNPYVNILGCMTPEVTSSLLKQQLLSTGFMRRVIWVNSSERGQPVPRPQFTPAQKEAYAACLRRGRELLRIKGQFVWEPSAATLFDAWYASNHARMALPNASAVMINMLRSRDQFVLKVAMIVTVCMGDELILRPEALQFAIDMLANIEQAAFRTFEYTGRNEIAFLSTKIMDYISHATSPTSMKEIYMLCHADATTPEIDQIVGHLQNTERAKRIVITKGQMQRTVLVTPQMALELDERVKQVNAAKLASPPDASPSVPSAGPARPSPDEL